DRGTGRARSVKIENVTTYNIMPIVLANVAPETHVMSDEHRIYKGFVGKHFAKHSAVSHGVGEYARGSIHTNTIEGFFSIFKRGMRGVYQFCSEKHLHRYLAEFDFRYSNRMALGVNDGARAAKALKGIRGKRLTYRLAHSQGRPEIPF